MKYCVYVTHHPNGYFYIGKAITKNILELNYKGSGKMLNDCFKKYPREEWTTDIIQDQLGNQEAYDLEAYLMDEIMLAEPLNVNLMTGGNRGYKWCETSLKRFSDTAKTRPPITDETRAKLIASKIGKVRGPYIMTYLIHGNVGKKRTPEQKAVLSKSLTGRPATEATKERIKKMGLANKGRKHTPESKANMGASRLGQKRAPYKIKAEKTPAQLEYYARLSIKASSRKKVDGHWVYVVNMSEQKD